MLTTEHKSSFDQNGYIHLPGFYDTDEMSEMRDQFHDLIVNTDDRPEALKYSFMEPVEGYGLDSYNPKNVHGIMDQTLANDYWYNLFVEPRIVQVMSELLGPNLDFHIGKVRNNPPGFTNDQSWHQDWPYERHTVPELAAAITYLEENDVDAGATSVIPGSHLQGEYPTIEDSHTIPGDALDADPVVVYAKPGDVVVRVDDQAVVSEEIRWVSGQTPEIKVGKRRLRFDKDALINGILYQEILGSPRSERMP